MALQRAMSCMVGMLVALCSGVLVSNWPRPCADSGAFAHLLFALLLATLDTLEPTIRYTSSNVRQNQEFSQLSQCCHTEYRAIHTCQAPWTMWLCDVLYTLCGIVTFGQVSTTDCILPLVLSCIWCRSRDCVSYSAGSMAIVFACLSRGHYGASSARLLCLSACVMVSPFVQCQWFCHALLGIWGVLHETRDVSCCLLPALIPLAASVRICQVRPCLAILSASVGVMAFGF